MTSAETEKNAAAARREELLRSRLAGRRGARRAVGITRADREQPLRLSAGQQQMWFLNRLDPESAEYLVPLVLRLRGTLDAAALETAWNRIVARHEILRTRYTLLGVEPVQLVDEAAAVALPLTDLSGEPRRAREEVERAVRRGFDLAAEWPARAGLFRLAEDDHVLAVVFHHIACDAWSVNLFAAELGASYTAALQGADTGLPELDVQYADFAAWQREQLDGPAMRKQLTYWREQLADSEATELPTDRPRPEVRSTAGADVPLAFSAELAGKVRTLAEAHGTTPFAVLLTAFQVLVSRYTGRTDVNVGTVVSGRTRPELQRLIGYGINTLVMRARWADDPGFGELLDRARATVLDAFDHQEVPFARLVDELQPERDTSRTPLHQVALTWHEERDGLLALPGLAVEPFEFADVTAKYDLLLQVEERKDGGLGGRLQYATALFDAATAERMAGHLAALLDAATAAPATPVSRLALLGAEERAVLTGALDGHLPSEPVRTTLHRRFEEWAARTPDAVAVVADGRELTFAEVNERANRLAHHLRSLGVGPEDLVGVCLERGAELVPTLLGVLKSGAGYLPMDPANPAERLGYILADSGAKVAVVHQATRGLLAPVFTGELVDAEVADGPTTDPEPLSGPENTVYVIYTSGSTGKPKGCVLTHANVLRLFDTTRPQFGFGPDDVWTMFHSYAFDFSVWEIWGAVLHGGRVVIVPSLTARDPELFLDLLAERRVTVLNQTPSAFAQLIRTEGRRTVPAELALRTVVFGGEALDFAALREWVERRGLGAPELVNMYGITETTVHTTHHRVGAADLASGAGNAIGHPLADLGIRLLDGNGELAPIGVPGEIHVAGPGVARGYLGRPELTAERFVPDPWGPAGSRLYRSGDLARRRPDGSLEFLGRIDTQVKIRGYRIELGEIAKVLQEHPGVKDGVVVAREDVPGDKRLVAYLVPAGADLPAAADLAGHCSAALPGYMVPTAFVALERIPLTVNGKLDQRALPAPDQGALGTAAAYVAPRTPVEEQVAAVWSEVLGVERVGVEDGFFELGGDSIRAVALVGALRESGFDLAVRDVFEHRTVARLAELITGRPAATADDRTVEPFALISDEDRALLPEGVTDAYPLSQVQLGMVVEMLADEGLNNYHNVSAGRIKDDRPFDHPAFEAAVRFVTERHEMLRTSIHLNGFSRPMQLVHATAATASGTTDLRGLDAEEATGRIRAFTAAERADLFDLTVPSLMRYHALVTDDGWWIAVTECHPVMEGWSQHSLLMEILRTYVRIRDGLAPESPGIPDVRFADFIAGELESLESVADRAYWQGVVQGHARYLLPTGWGDATAERGTVKAAADLRDLEPALRALATKAKASFKSVVIAAHLKVLSQLTEESSFHSGLVCDARPERLGADRVLGMYLNTLPIVHDRSARTWRELVAATFAHEVGLWPHRRYPFPAIQREWGGAERLMDVYFNYQDFHQIDGDLLDQETEAIDDSPTEFPLTVASRAGHIILTASPRSISPANLERMAGMYRAVLEAMAADPDGDATAIHVSPAELAFLTDGADQRVTPVEATVHQLFERQAARTPDALAVSAGDVHLTYAEVNERANRLAHHLRSHGVGAEDLVGMCLERGADLLPTLLGILKSGAGYLPLDPAHPSDRLGYALEDSGAKLAIVSPGTSPVLADVFPGTVVELARDAEAIAARPATNPEPVSSPEHVIYVIYTSGSTGKPKGCVLTHTNVVRLMTTAHEHYGFDGSDVFSMSHSYAFDVSVFEMWGALLFGGRVVVVPTAVTRSPEDFLDLLVTERVTVLSQTPTAFRSLVSAAVERDPRLARLALRAVVFAGEKLEVPELRPWVDLMGLTGPELINMYGITETTVHSTFHRIEEEDLDPLAGNRVGDPLGDLRIHLLDRAGRMVPVGVPGEIHVAGPGVARGYLGRPELTAERFVPDPWGPAGSRLYRSGDLARRRADGTLEFLGRIDTQVKIRGYRIELGEIAGVMLEHPGIRQAVVVVRDDRLVGYLVPSGEESPSAKELRALLARSLPDYMVPAAFVTLAAMPLTVNGKFDKAALPAPDGLAQVDEAEYVAPRSSVEEQLAAVWSEVLGAERVGVEDGFFELGGDSIRAVTLVGALRRAGYDVAVKDVFERRTVAGLGELITGRPAPAEALAAVEPFALLADEDLAALPQGVEDAYPATQVQLGMLVEMLAGGEASYHQCVSYRINDERPFDESALRLAVRELTRRHETLRTSFDLTGFSTPLQLVHREVDVPVTVHDLRELDEAGRRAALEGFFATERADVFDPATPPLLRVAVHLDEPDGWRLAFTQPHALTQGWSQFALLTELVEVYRAYRDGGAAGPYEAPGVRFADFVAGELASLASAEDRGYWQGIVGRHAPVTVPAGWGAEGEGRPHVSQVPLGDLEQPLRAFAARAKVSVKSVLLAAHLKVMSQLGEDERFHTGLVCDARPEAPGADRVQGMYLNTLPFAADRSARTWRELVEQVFAREVELWSHRRYPLQAIQRELAGGRRQIDVIFNYHDFRGFDSAEIDATAAIGQSSTEFALSVATGGAGLNLTADTSVLSPANGARLAGMYRAVLSAMAADPDGDARTTYLAPQDEERLAAWTATDREQVWLMAEAEFERHAALTPHRPAITADGQVLDYAEVNTRANRLAHHLRELGVGPDTLVGICADRSPSTVIAVLAVLKAGGAYLPLDPDHPAERLGYMAQDAEISVLLTETHRMAPLLAAAPGLTALPVLLDRPEEWSHAPADDPAPLAGPDDLAYVIYTSGSTGRPKGVLVHRRGMANHLLAKIEDLGLTAADSVVQNASMAFDISVWQMLSTLVVGGSVRVVDAVTSVDPLALLPRVAEERITVLEVVPSLLRAAMDAWDSGALTAELPDLRWMVVTGEALPPDLCRRWFRRFPAVPMVNAYGPTECSDDVTHALIAAGDPIGEARVTIGRSVRNTRLRVLDAAMAPVPVGVAGELYVGGVGVARGYGGRPELTAERFLPDPWGPAGSRLYRTGDVVAWNDEGGLEFLGRVDHQVKIRGVRIELGEIEAALTRLPYIAEAVAAVRTDPNGHQRLVGYLVPVGGEPARPDELRELLARSLPDTMIPQVFMELDTIPLTANGKVDRKVLPEPEAWTEPDRVYVEPRTDTERRIAALWSAALGVERIGTEDNFFRLGGDSILVIRVIAAARQADLPISLFMLYQHDTLGQLAAAVDLATGSAPRALDVPAPLAPTVAPAGRRVSLDSLTAVLAEVAVPGASIAVVEGGELVALEALGTLAAGSSEPVTPDTLFQVGSWGKHVTALGVLTLVREGLIGLDEDVNRYLTSWQLPGTVKVTVRQLLSHTAGLTETPRRGVRRGQPVATPVELLRGEVRPASGPVRQERAGTFRQSNAHYTLLEQMLTDVTGEAFADLMDTLVLRPLGMANSSFDQSFPETAGRPVALGHDERGQGIEGGWLIHPEKSAAGLWSTAADLAKFELEVRRCYLGRPLGLIGRELAEQMLTPHSTSFFGLGTIVDTSGPDVEFGHGGSPGGYQAVSMFKVHQGSGLVVLTNGESSAQVVKAASAALQPGTAVDARFGEWPVAP
ncbi:non-ribosomal peptide synthetase [Kitasatospora brasiliensis]|uniref:non-ribosomal peptide synthetase n=1 Tax=Kitasatospora brasiliensis TaxID=3058040 RepID=UPI00292D81FD|nr:non-ribosomal peptide synthetase [Kitasatospora sp. K002]